MFRIKNNTEFAESGHDECWLAGCHRISDKIWANSETQIVDVCDYHYAKLILQTYGE